MEDLTHVHPILKKLFSKQKIPKCAPAGRIKEFLPAWKLLTRDQEVLALVEGYQISLLMEPVQEKAPKVLKLNQEQQKQVDLEVKEKGSISKVCHFLICKKGWENRPVINLNDLNRFIPYKHFKMEGLHCLKYVLQKGNYMCKIDLKDAYFSVPLHKDSRKLVRFLWAGNLYDFLLWFGTSSQNIQKIIKGSNLSFGTSYDKGHNLSRRFIDFGKQYERNVYGKGLCDLSIATSRLCNKSEEVCVRSCTGNRVLRGDCEYPNYDFVITSGKDREDKGSMPEVIQGIKGNTSGFDKANRNTFFNHSSSAPSTSTVSFLTTTANCISETITVLPHFGKADSHGKKRVVMVG